MWQELWGCFVNREWMSLRCFSCCCEWLTVFSQEAVRVGARIRGAGSEEKKNGRIGQISLCRNKKHLPDVPRTSQPHSSEWSFLQTTELIHMIFKFVMKAFLWLLFTCIEGDRHIWAYVGTSPVLALKFLHVKSPLSSRQTRRAGHPMIACPTCRNYTAFMYTGLWSPISTHRHASISHFCVEVMLTGIQGPKKFSPASAYLRKYEGLGSIKWLISLFSLLCVLRITFLPEYFKLFSLAFENIISNIM